jgi:hypothetical protein
MTRGTGESQPRRAHFLRLVASACAVVATTALAQHRVNNSASNQIGGGSVHYGKPYSSRPYSSQPQRQMPASAALLPSEVRYNAWRSGALPSEIRGNIASVGPSPAGGRAAYIPPARQSYTSSSAGPLGNRVNTQVAPGAPLSAPSRPAPRATASAGSGAIHNQPLNYQVSPVNSVYDFGLPPEGVTVHRPAPGTSAPPTQPGWDDEFRIGSPHAGSIKNSTPPK